LNSDLVGMRLVVTVGRCSTFVSIRAIPRHHKQCLYSSQPYQNSYLNRVLKDILSAVHLYRNYPTYNVIYVYDIYYIYFRRERNLSVHSVSII